MRYEFAIVLGALAFAGILVAPHGMARTAVSGSSSSTTAGASAAAGGGCTDVYSFAPADNTEFGVWYLSTVTGAGQVSTVDLAGMGGDLETNQPLPTGAVLLETFADNQDRASAGVLNLYGQPDDVFSTLVIEYSWHKASNPGQTLAAAPTLRLAFFNPECDDPESAGDCFGQLIYEPAWNGPGATSPNGPSTNPPLDTWTSVTIDENNGLFWWTGGFGQPNSAGAPPVRTLAEWRALFSSDFGDSQLFRVEIGVGSFNQNQIGYFDDVRISHGFGDGFDECYDFEAFVDCNGNRIADGQDITDGTSQDCNSNAIPDECDIAEGTSQDCNANGIPDECELADGTSQDCNANGIPDECDVADGTSLDCNKNGIPDECDIAAGTSQDCNANGIPDECDIASGTSLDCNLNGRPDDCDLADGTSQDCNANGIPDECDIAAGTSQDCNKDGVPDECNIADGTSLDCNANGIPDECEFPDGRSQDCNGNGIPDECDIADGTSLDCNKNGIPDECDIAAGTSQDCNANGIPDECDIAGGTSLDCNLNGRPDDCDLADGTSQDCNGNAIPDECDIVNGTSLDCNENGIPDECDGGCDLNCVEFDRTIVLTPSDTVTLITNFHNPESHQGYAYLFAVDDANAPIAFDWIIGQVLIIEGLGSFDYSVNAVDFRAMVPEGNLTDVDADGIRDLNGVEYEHAAAELLVPRFFGQGNGHPPGQLILIGLSGGVLFDTTVDFLIYNDNEEGFSAEHTFRCWEKVDLLGISGLFHNDFLMNWTNHNPNESIGAREYGWFRVFGAVASSSALSIDDPAIYAVYVERSGSSLAASDLPFEICTRSGHLLPRSIFGDNEEQASGGQSDRDCSTNIPRRRPGSLLLYPEFDNRAGVVSVLTVTNTHAQLPVRVNMRYIGRFSG